MILAEKLLHDLSEWQPSGAGRHSFSTEEAGWNVHVSADKADSLSCLVWELTQSRTADAPANLTLNSWAEGICARVSGLREPLKIHEIDNAAQIAVLRSTQPNAKGDALAYYEVKLHGLGRAVVRRFAASKVKTGRDQVAFALTHEVLAQLAEGIAG